MSDSVKYIKYNGGVEASAFTKTNGTANDVLLADGTTIAISDLLSDYYTKDEADELYTSIIKIKGTIGGGDGSISTLPTDAEVGDAYIVDSDAAPSYEGHSVESGDIFVWIKQGDREYWTVIQSNWTASLGSSDLSWGSNTTLATVGGVTINAKLPTNPVDELEIGGRNLLRNSNFSDLADGTTYNQSTYWLYSADSKYKDQYSLTVSNGYLKLTSTVESWGATTPRMGFRQTKYNISGQKYILSFDAYADTPVYIKAETGHGDWEDGLRRQITTDKQRYSIEITGENGSSNNYNVFFLRLDENIKTSIYFNNFKLEQGNKATDWTPAPEDCMDAIAALQRQVDGEVNSWLMEGEPTTTNKPANEWTGTDENGATFDYRQRHEGDTYTNIENAILLDSSMWEQGGIVWNTDASASGGDQASDCFVRTKYINVEGCSQLLRLGSDYYYTIFYYDSNKTCLKVDEVTAEGLAIPTHLQILKTVSNQNVVYFRLRLGYKKKGTQYLKFNVGNAVDAKAMINPTAGQSWRWCNTDDKYGTGWHWHKIADSDAVKALTIANGVREDFDNLEIGGVNLLPNTRTGVGFTFQPLPNTGSSGEFDSTNKWFKFTCPQNVGTNSLTDTILLKSPTVLLTPGTYTVSCLYRCTLPLNRMQVLCLPVTSEGSYDMNTLSFAFEVKSSSPVTYFQKYSATFNISEDLRDVYGWIIRIDLDHRGSHGNSQELYVKDIKLEKGHKATDWTPTLEGEYLPLSGGTMQGNINFKNEFNTIYGDYNNLYLHAHTAINLDALETNINNIFPQTDTSNIGSSSNAFNNVYAKRFIIPGGTGNLVLLDNGGVKPLSEFTTSSGITQLKIGDGLQGKDNKDAAITEITTSGTITLKTASDSDIGGIKLGYSENGKNYPVEISTDKKAYVNVPWTDNKVTQSVSTSNGAYPLLCKLDTTNDTVTNSVKFVSGVTVNPSTNTITTPKLNISHTGASGDDFNNNVKYPVSNKALVIGTVANKTTCLYINRSGIQAWNSTTDTKLTDSSIPSMHLQGAGGNVICGGAVNAAAFYETSDIRKKEIKSDLSLDKCYDLIDKCQTVIYSLKDQTQELVGMIAQEIEEFFPEVVATDEEGFKSLAYDRLVVICFKVLKDVIKRLEKLES